MILVLIFIHLIKLLLISLMNACCHFYENLEKRLNWNNCVTDLRWQSGVEALANCSPSEFQPCELFPLFPEWTSADTHKVQKISGGVV